MRRASIVLALAVALATAALAQQVPPDRSSAPRPGPAPEFKPPTVQKRQLSNGLPVWFVEMHKVPVAHVTLVVRSGSAADPAGKFGVASLTSEMLDEGAGARDALQIADAVEYLGASLSTESSYDASYIDLQVPVARLPDALAIVADVGLRPTFPEKELQRIREELLTNLLQAQDDPEELVRFAFPRLVYGPAHRYGTLSVGTAAAIKGFSPADLERFHSTHYVPANAALMVAGDTTPDQALPLLENAFGSWKGPAPAAAPLGEARQLTSRQLYLIDKPGAAQSQIRIGWIGVPRSTPDYFALRVLNTVLGGSFTSRLNTNLREEHGYSYGAGSAFEMRAAAGPFYATAGVQTDKTSESLQEFFEELGGIRQPIPAEELEKAKNYVALSFPMNFETTASVAASMAQQFVYNLPDDFYATFTRRVRAVTAADIQRAAERYIQPDKFAVVVVGDRKVVEPGIRALKLGPIRIVTVEEVM
jgi:predicted Zn-dependent peptidase